MRGAASILLALAGILPTSLGERSMFRAAETMFVLAIRQHAG